MKEHQTRTCGAFKVLICSISGVMLLALSFFSIAAAPEDPAIIKSDSLYRKADYRASIDVLMARLVSAQKNKEQNVQTVIYNSLGKAYSQLGNSIQSLKYYQLAIKLADLAGDKQRSGKILKNIGALYEEQKNFVQALAYYDKAERIAIEINDESLLADCYNNQGIVYEQQLNYDKALEVYKTALGIYQKLNKTDRVALSLNNIGIVYKFLGKYPLAIEYYNKSLQYSEKLGDRFFMAANLNNMGNVYAMMRNYPKAIELNTRSLKIAEEIKATNIVVEATGSIAEDYAGAGNYKKAYEVRNQFLKVNDEYINVERSKQLAEMQTLYETEKKERQISTLKQTQQINALSMAKQTLLIQKRNYQIFFITLITLILAISGYLFYRRQRIKQLEEAERAIAETERKERTRIAKDVHDDIGSGLSKITLMADMANQRMQANGVEGSEINYIYQISKDLVENMRDLIWVLNPETSTLDNLVARIREYSSDFVEGLSLHIEFDIQDDVPDIKISQQVQRNVFLTVKEALHNCVKHADCNKVHIALSYTDGLLNINIADSGKGFDVEVLKRNGNGLRNMQNRLESIGGTFKLSSVSGTGTTVNTQIKLA